MLRLDHVVYAAPDLDEAEVRFREEFGLDSSEGGRHERWGTANRIVPLGDQYLELVAAVDGSKAAGTAFGGGLLERKRWAVPLEIAQSGAGALFVGPGWDITLLGLAEYLSGHTVEDRFRTERRRGEGMSEHRERISRLGDAADERSEEKA